MNRFTILLLIVAVFISPCFSQRIAFIRGKDVVAGEVSGKVFQKITRLGGNAAKGDDLQLCSDGRSVAYTLSIDVKHPKGSGKPDFERYIELSNLDGTGCVRLPDSGEKNSFGPRWSPDNQRVAFDRLYRSPLSQDLQWVVSIATRDLKEGMRLQNPALDHGYFVYTWTPDGNLAVMGNDTINTFDRSGSIIEAVPLTLDTLGGTSFSPSSADIISISPDGRFMLWILTGADEGSRNFAALYDEEDLYGIMMVYDRITRVLHRISPKSMAMAFEPPAWLPDGRTVVFAGIQAAKPFRKGAHPTTDLFSMDVDGSNLAKIAVDAHDPVVLK